MKTTIKLNSINKMFLSPTAFRTCNRNRTSREFLEELLEHFKHQAKFNSKIWKPEISNLSQPSRHDTHSTILIRMVELSAVLLFPSKPSCTQSPGRHRAAIIMGNSAMRGQMQKQSQCLRYVLFYKAVVDTTRLIAER